MADVILYEYEHEDSVGNGSEPVSVCDFCGSDAYYIRVSTDPVWCPECLREALSPG